MSRDDAIDASRDGPDAVRTASSRMNEVKAPQDAALNPLLVRERRPDVVRLRDDGLVRAEDDLRAVLGHVQRS